MDTLKIVALIIILKSDTAFSDYCNSNRTEYAKTNRHCGLWGWSRCSTYRPYTVLTRVCCPGWQGNGCMIPICNNPCKNGGKCIGPDQCDCPSSFTDQQCSAKVCSHIAPCYPGTCSLPHTCTCFHGFTDSGKGCLSFSSDNNAPSITTCEVTLARIRRIDKKQQFYFNVPCSDGSKKDTIWWNQQLFNYAEFTMKSFYPKIPNLPPAPDYVHECGFGIVYSGVHVNHTKVPRSSYSNRSFVALDKNYTCSGLSNTTPQKNISSCKQTEEKYRINIEHDDIITVTYSTKSGGFRKLYDTDTNMLYSTQIYNGQTTTKIIELKFDFIAPMHCSEILSKTKCSYGEKPIDVGEDITRKPIHLKWDGWSDSLSGIDYYYLEVFKLEPNIHNDLTELEPLKPIYQFTTNKSSSINFPTYYPPQTGMCSILLQVSDKANNSKIARRLVLFDNDSSISLSKPAFNPNLPVNISDVQLRDGGMHVITAIPETGYMWQTSKKGTSARIVLNWENHFINKIYDQGKLLNRVLKYPTQFAELEDKGVLNSKKYVNLIDNEGARTRSSFPNIHGIVKFEVNKVYTDDRQVPKSGWMQHNLSESYDISEELDDGSHVRLWVRATDIMNDTIADYTEVHIDNTPPRIAANRLYKNIVNGTYTHTSRITFEASDDDSGVYRLDYTLTVGNSTSKQCSGTFPANRNNDSDACRREPMCRCVLRTCFLVHQQIDIDNCLFLVPKEDLNKSASIEVKVYNQAHLFNSFTKRIEQLSELKGLEDYSGPTNIRVKENISGGVRLVWDLPKTASCYDRADLDIVLYNLDGSIRKVKVYDGESSVDLIGLEPDKDYKISLKLVYKGTELVAIPYSFKTGTKEKKYLSYWVIAGIIFSMLIIIGILIVIFVILLKKGHMKPVRRGLNALSIRYRKSVARFRSRTTPNDLT